MSDYKPDVEERMGIEPVDRLLAKRWDLVNKSADLQALHGRYGTWQDSRKAAVSRIKMMLRAQALRDKVRKTEAQLDEESHCHPAYTEMLTEATSQRAEWVRIDARISAIDTKIMRDQAVARYVTNEPR